MYKNTETEILKAVESTGLKNLAVKVGRGANVLFEKYYSSEFSGEKVNETTLFDMASVTKVAATTIIALYALDTGKIQLTDPLSRYFVCGNDKKNIPCKIFSRTRSVTGINRLCGRALPMKTLRRKF